MFKTVTQYRAREVTEASPYIYIYIYINTPIYPLYKPATNYCPENGLNLMFIMECPNIYKIFPSLVLHPTLTRTDSYQQADTLVKSRFLPGDGLTKLFFFSPDHSFFTFFIANHKPSQQMKTLSRLSLPCGVE